MFLLWWQDLGKSPTKSVPLNQKRPHGESSKSEAALLVQWICYCLILNFDIPIFLYTAILCFEHTTIIIYFRWKYFIYLKFNSFMRITPLHGWNHFLLHTKSHKSYLYKVTARSPYFYCAEKCIPLDRLSVDDVSIKITTIPVHFF